MSVLWTRYASDFVTLVDLQDGTSRVTLQYFYKTSADASEPTVPQGNFEYDFLSGVLTASVSTAFTNWSTSPDNLTFSEALWMVSITLEGPVGSTATFNQDDWNGPVVLSRVGFQPTQPDPATNVATVFIFRPKGTAANGAVNAPTKVPTGPFSYDFETGTLSPTTVGQVTGDLDGWSQDLPAIVPGQYIWVKQATASNTSGTDVIYGDEFSAPTLLSGTGLDGYNTAVVQLYNKNSDASSAPADPTGSFKHTFSTGLLTAESGADFKGWTQSAPSITNGEYLWIIQGSAVGRGDTDLINGAEFGDAQIVGVGGENAVSPTITAVEYDENTGVTTVTITDENGETDLTITDGDAGTSEGVTVIYANDSSGDGKNTVRQTGQEYVLYYEWNGIENKPNSNLSNLRSGLTWVKFVGETPNAPPAQGVVPVYSSVQNPSAMNQISLTLGTKKFVTFYEWTAPKPTQDSHLPNTLLADTVTYVQFVADEPDAPDQPDQPDPPPRYYSIRMYSETATAGEAPAKATLTWNGLSVAPPTGWSMDAPTINANTTSTTWYFSDLVFIDTSGVAPTTEDFGTQAQKVVSFDGIVTFTNSGDSDVILSDGNTDNNRTVYALGGSTEINGGRISANSLSLGAVQNSTSDVENDLSSMVLDPDTITINDSSGNPRVILGKLPAV
jgi:hypothetical protein